MEDFQFKAAALDFALRLNAGDNNTDTVLEDAQRIYEFLKGQ